jgi:hypothetical protein
VGRGLDKDNFGGLGFAKTVRHGGAQIGISTQRHGQDGGDEKKGKSFHVV